MPGAPSIVRPLHNGWESTEVHFIGNRLYKRALTRRSCQESRRAAAHFARSKVSDAELMQ